MDTIDQAAELLREAEAACDATPEQIPRIVSETMARVVTLPKTTEQAERVIGLVILRLNVLLGRQAPDEVWAIARRAKESTQSA
jgi:hypothetical protein